jgi:hypothetical protein
MSYSPITVEVARFHTQDLRAEAGRRRLARVAACCKPSYLAARFAELRGRLVHRDVVAACCS